METAKSLLAWLGRQDALKGTLPVADLADKALALRDGSESESAWLREEAAVRMRASLPEASMELVEAVSERAFKRAFDLSQHDELAAQVADDFRLLAEASEVGYQSPTLEALWAVYSSGRFPEVIG